MGLSGGRMPGGPVEYEVGSAAAHQRDGRREQGGAEIGGAVGISGGVGVEEADEPFVVRGRERDVGPGDGAEFGLGVVEARSPRAQEREREDGGVLDGGGVALGGGGGEFVGQRLEHKLVAVVINEVSASG